MNATDGCGHDVGGKRDEAEVGSDLGGGVAAEMVGYALADVAFDLTAAAAIVPSAGGSGGCGVEEEALLARLTGLPGLPVPEGSKAPVSPDPSGGVVWLVAAEDPVSVLLQVELRHGLDDIGPHKVLLCCVPEVSEEAAFGPAEIAGIPPVSLLHRQVIAASITPNPPLLIADRVVVDESVKVARGDAGG